MFLRLAFVLTSIELCSSANILMMTLGGSKSHKIPFWELSRGLSSRGHNITFLNGYRADFHQPGLEEITPYSLVEYIKNFTNWDLLGTRMSGVQSWMVVHPLDVIRYAHESCDIFLSDPEIKNFLKTRLLNFDLMIADGAYPECSLGLAHHFNIPYMYINTVGFYTASLSSAGNPAPFSVTPIFSSGYSDNMNIIERTINTAQFMVLNMMHWYTVNLKLDAVLRKTFGKDMPSSYEMTRNVSFILQNAHATVTYPRPYLPNVAEIACIHCKPAKSLPKDLEEFINSGEDTGFIYVSMGSAVRAVNMPDRLKQLLLRVFEQLPYKVLWKWESELSDAPSNVKTGRWLPQQDILGHKKIRAFVTHGGLLSMFETVYHGVPVISMPVFCDHEANAVKAELDGYALKLELSTLTVDILTSAINKVIHDSRYRREVKRRQTLLRDQKESPLERAVYWTEYVLRHKGAYHLQSPSKDLHWTQYYLLDVVLVYLVCIVMLFISCKYLIKMLSKALTSKGTRFILSQKEKVS